MSQLTFDNHEDWLAARRRFIGSSDAPAILGYGYANQSKMSVYADKTCEADARFSKSTQARLDLGKIGERFVLAVFEQETGFPVITNEKPTICVHDELNYVAASVDAYTEPAPGVRRIVEAKMVMNREAWSEWDGNNPPLKHSIQVQHQLFCAGLSRGYLVGWTGDQVRIFEIDRHEEFIQTLRKHIDDFWWNHVVPRIPPTVDGSEATKAAIYRMFPQSGDYAIALGVADEEVLERYEQVRSQIKELEATELELGNRLRMKLGDASYGISPNGRCISWKTVPVREHMVKARIDRRLLLHKSLPKGVNIVLKAVSAAS